MTEFYCVVPGRTRHGTVMSTDNRPVWQAAMLARKPTWSSGRRARAMLKRSYERLIAAARDSSRFQRERMKTSASDRHAGAEEDGEPCDDSQWG
jgi:hypothetical protein